MDLTNNYVLGMAVVNLGLSFWNLYLQKRNTTLEEALEGAHMMVCDLAEGNATIEKTPNGFIVKRSKRGQQ